MYVLERLEGDSTRQLLASPDIESVERLLLMIIRSRSKTAKSFEDAEHLRAAAYRFSCDTSERNLLTLDGEHFCIYKSSATIDAVKPNKQMLRRIARSTPRLSPVLDEMTSAQTAAIAARGETEREPGWIPPSGEDPVQISGERFEI